MAPTTLRLYREAFIKLWRWVGRPPPEALASKSAYDRLLARYIEHAWEVGETLGDTGNALSASTAVFPELKGRGNLTESWYMLNAWRRFEVPLRAPPMPAKVLLGLAWYCICQRQVGMAFLLVAGYDAFLRTGEMLSLVLADVNIDGDGRGVVSLGHTKTGRRHAAFEAATLNDPMSGRLFRALVASLPPGTHAGHYVFLPKAHVFYRLFKSGLKWLGVEGLGFTPYSIRRGGATAFFRVTRNMEATLDRGRWSNVRAARIYVNDGLAKEVELRLSADTEARLDHYICALQRWLASQ